MATKSTKINAGVLLIELNCDNGAGRHENAFLMLQSGASVPKQQQNYRKRKQDLVRTYSDGGGKQEPDDLDSTYTAAREMREESAGLIAIPPQALAKTLVIDIGYKYLCYVIATDTPIDTSLFQKNRKCIKNAPMSWKEASAFTKFYFSDLLTRTRADMTTDIHGVDRMLSTRAQRILTEVILMRNDPIDRISIISLMPGIATAPDFAIGTSIYEVADTVAHAESIAETTAEKK